ncbi:MAG: hypothetical protein MUC56_10015 [Thermoanaerobaculales bacterium]|jgi:hypothetical protein|nr:hypothetical protein [Thermoanaerobaculales bacterium]
MTRHLPTETSTLDQARRPHRRPTSLRLALTIAGLCLAANGAAEAAPPADYSLAPGASAGLTGRSDGVPLLYDNGPFITCFGCGSGGADESGVETSIGLGTVGFPFRQSAGESVADDFTVPTPFSWTIDSMVFYSCANDASTVDGVYVRIWDGPPDAGGAVVWGDLTSNRLASSQLVNVFRVADWQTGQPLYPVRESFATPGVTLGPGAYGLEWAINPSFPVGPSAPPVAILGQTTIGSALGASSGAWAPPFDLGSAATPKGLPFPVVGSATGSSGPLYVLDDNADTLTRVDLLDGGTTWVGPTGTPVSRAGMALDTSTGTAYVSDVQTRDGSYGLGWIDLWTGRITLIGPHVTSDNIWGLAYDSLNDVLYGIDRECPDGGSAVDGLAILDRTTGASSCIGPFGAGATVFGLAYDSTGDTLYALDTTQLLAVNRITGVATVVGPHGINTLQGDSALEYAPDLGVLIASSDNGDLWTIDPGTGAGILLHSAVVPSPSGTVYVPPGARLAAFGPFPGRLWDNGDTDLAQALSNGVPPGLFARRTLLDDLEVPAGESWTLRHLRWRHVWDMVEPPAGSGAEIAVRANDPNGGGPGVDGPGAVVATATVRFFVDSKSGREAFGRFEALSIAEFDPIVLTGGRYWVEWAVIGPDNSFALANGGAIRDNQCWVDYQDAGGLQPSQTFWGTPYDLSWAVGETAIGVFADGFESGDPGAWAATAP